MTNPTPTNWRALCAELLLFAEQAGEIAANESLWPKCDPDCSMLDRTAAALAQPEPQGPTDEELMALAVAVFEDPFSTDKDYARAVLARWGRPAIEPVPVAERLPKRELNELDDQGTCWMFHPVNYHYCLCVPDPSVHTHWLPYWALPVPQQEAE
jgi:hypothetical protein